MAYLPGDSLLNGKYQITSCLGRGGFGEVYLAQHLKLHAPRALKILRVDAPGVGPSDIAEARRRFRLEAQIGAELEQAPHVIHVHDFEEDEGVLVLVMEYTPDGSLADRIARARELQSPMRIEEVVRIARDVASGLAAVHELDVVHRDLKPSNILFDAQERARVADLGLAQVLGGPSRTSALEPEDIRHPGTPEYMSPEQRASGERLLPASDVYALGAILFEMLTGRLYCQTRPGTAPRDLRSAVPPWLDALVLRCLSREPTDRPWDGAELIALLEAGDGAHAKSGPVNLQLAPGVALAFTEIPAGEFLMGSDPHMDPDADEDEYPQRRIYLETYYMGITPVTPMQFAAFVQATRYRTTAETRGFSVAFTGSGFEKVSGAYWRQPRGPGSQAKDEHPVVHIAWEDARAFCQWASQVTGWDIRLPTEAEWEKAARGAEGIRFPWRDAPPDATRCNIGRHIMGTSPVGAFSPAGDSPYGCADMAGNVWEWCADWYAADAYAGAPVNNPIGPSTGAFRVVRGGAWHDETDFARAALRLWHVPEGTHALLGFRCVALRPKSYSTHQVPASRKT